jgi:hypothetical protein
MKKVVVTLFLAAIAVFQSAEVKAQATTSPVTPEMTQEGGTVIGPYDPNDPTGSNLGIITVDNTNGDGSTTQVDGCSTCWQDDDGTYFYVGRNIRKKSWHDGFSWYY